jgi:FkbH-like protein
MSFPELHWLPEMTEWDVGLRHEVLLADGSELGIWERLVTLANARIDSLATLRLDRSLRRLFGDRPPAAVTTRPVRLAVLASSTADHLLPGIRVAGLRHGLHVQTYVAENAQYISQLMDTGSPLHAFGPDTVLFALDAHHLLRGISIIDQTAAKDWFEELCHRMQQHWRLARDSFDCKVVQQAILPVFPCLFGNNEQRLPGSPIWLVNRLNNQLRVMADAEQIDLLSLDIQAARDGLSAWHDTKLWHLAKQEVHPSAAHLYGELIGRLLAAHQGRSRKCLVLDLDNTLWGGVVGEEGPEGIVLGQGSALGEAFVAFQQYARDLSRRGVILAVCSKNDETNALEPFDSHPEMVLQRSDIACFISNWTNKAANVREIAHRLNIGLDSLVFVDDNPAERAIVRRELPMVAVPELPDDPTLFPICLASAGYFEGTHLTSDDLARARRYQENSARESLKTSATDLEGYLESLAMEARWSRFDRVGLLRTVQLINKTNQFNLTTRRTTEEEIVQLIDNPNVLTLQIRLLDRFGDNGVVAIVIAREALASDLRLDTWVMSCRVLGRGLEQTTLNLVAAEARRLGATRLIGEYRPTAKNGMVKDHYASLGFSHSTERAKDAVIWELDIGQFKPIRTHITAVAAR